MAIYSAAACLFFLILYITSSYLNTVNMLNSTAHLALLTSYIFAFFLSTGLVVKKRIVFFILVLLAVGSISLYALHILNLFPLPFFSHQDFQFILPTESGHNHLGDLVGLGLISSLFITFSPLLFVLQLVFFIMIGISFSKSALLALVFVAFLLMIHKKKYVALFIGITLISSILIGIYSKENIPFPPLNKAQKMAQTTLHITPKPLLSSRERYIKQILKPWSSTPIEHLFFGYGPGNFKYASNRVSESVWDVVSDTHNILLTFFVESGFLPLAWFVIFVSMIILIGYKNQDPLTFLVLYLFVHFQMDYTYRIPFFMYLFFFLCGQIASIQAKRFTLISFRNIFILISFSILVIFSLMNRIIAQRYQILNTNLNNGIQTQNKKMFVSAAKELERMTPYESDLLLTLASFHESFGNNEEAIRLLDALYLYTPREYFANLPHLMLLRKKMRKSTKTYLEEKEMEFKMFPFTEKEKSQLDHICREYLERECL